MLSLTVPVAVRLATLSPKHIVEALDKFFKLTKYDRIQRGKRGCNIIQQYYNFDYIFNKWEKIISA